MKKQPEAISDENPINSDPLSSSPAQQLPQPVHQMEADEEDENVKQLGDCSVLYLSLQAHITLLFLSLLIYAIFKQGYSYLL
ncbi:hypothetical protein KSS87_005589, partial [Heliosperma pusillum]